MSKRIAKLLPEWLDDEVLFTYGKAIDTEVRPPMLEVAVKGINSDQNNTYSELALCFRSYLNSRAYSKKTDNKQEAKLIASQHLLKGLSMSVVILHGFNINNCNNMSLKESTEKTSSWYKKEFPTLESNFDLGINPLYDIVNPKMFLLNDAVSNNESGNSDGRNIATELCLNLAQFSIGAIENLGEMTEPSRELGFVNPWVKFNLTRNLLKTSNFFQLPT